MDVIIRAAAVYLFLLLIFRLTGKRSFGEMTTFDFLLLLIISEATQQALMGEDFSLTAAMLVILTLVGLDVGLSFVKSWSPRADRWIDSLPLIIVRDGKPIQPHMQRERVDEEDVLNAAREIHGLERLDQIKYAVLERNGSISIIPHST
jgi:uncharacterized membrane protein YcaP (DUF421 family)